MGNWWPFNWIILSTELSLLPSSTKIILKFTLCVLEIKTQAFSNSFESSTIDFSSLNTGIRIAIVSKVFSVYVDRDRLIQENVKSKV